MRPTSISQTGVGRPTNVVIIDQHTAPANIALGCIVNGSVTYTVQHTYDDVFAPGFTAAGATWFNHSTLAAQTANADGNYAFPPRAISVNVTLGAGTVTLNVVQSGLGT
jgi:hypothetical protein